MRPRKIAGQVCGNDTEGYKLKVAGLGTLLGRIVAVPPIETRLGARISVGRFGQLDLYLRIPRSPGHRCVRHPRIPSQRTVESRSSDDSGLHTSARTGGPRTCHPSLRHEDLIPAAEPPADRFGTLASPAHSRRESWRSGGRHRPAPGFRDRWAGSRTETI